MQELVYSVTQGPPECGLLVLPYYVAREDGSDQAVVVSFPLFEPTLSCSPLGLLTALLRVLHVKFTSVKCMLQRLFCVFPVLCVIQVLEHYNNWKGV